MSYLMKFKGQYNLYAPYDLRTKIWPRDNKGRINQDDVRIDCGKKKYIYHYGHSTLVAYIGSVTIGKNIIKKLQEKIFDVLITNAEVEFKFHAKQIDAVAEVMGARTNHKNRSPFSVKNLPREKQKYVAYTYKNPDIPKQIKEKCLQSGLGIKKFYAELYQNLSKSLGFDVVARAKRENLKPLQYLDKYDLSKEIMNIC
jgi:hypothetical protein